MDKDQNTCDLQTGVCNIMSAQDEAVPEGAYCDPQTGVCNIMGSHPPEHETESNTSLQLDGSKPFQLVYVTDPICCYCWQVEPELQKFIAHYGHVMDTKILMGGLLESWEGFADEGNAIRQPADVGAHWREAAAHYGMPIDGTVWDKDPLESSYPASIIYKLVQQISGTSARRFLRAVREEVMVFNRNVARDDVLMNILERNDRNGKKLVADSKTPEARALLEADIQLGRSLGAWSFPTVVLINAQGEGIRVAGMKDFATYEQALQSIATDVSLEPAPLPQLKELFDLSRHVFFKEIQTMYELEPQEVEPFIAHNLPQDSYELREILNRRYVIRK